MLATRDAYIHFYLCMHNSLLAVTGPVIITGLQAPPDTSADEAYAMDEMAGEEELVEEEEVTRVWRICKVIVF